MGDVYRLVYFVSSFMQGWRFACLQDPPFQLVMWRGNRSGVEKRNLREVAELSFADLLRTRAAMNPRPSAEILADYRADHHNQEKTPVVQLLR